MGESKFPPELYLEFKRAGHNNQEIAEILGVGEASVRRGLKKIKGLLPEKPIWDLETPLRVEGNVAVTADWHIPICDYQYANKFIKDAQRLKMKTLIIGGDFFNFDALSQFDLKQDAPLELELTEASFVMQQLLETFKEIYFIWGNHDARLHKALGYKLQFDQAMDLVFSGLTKTQRDKIRFSNLDHIYVESGGRDWYICHPQSYARQPLSTTRRISYKERGANIITAHAHHCAVGYAEDGQTVLAEAGGLFDANQTAYLRRTTTHPRWTQGYGFIIEGRLQLNSPGWQINA
jgi:predicted phosphodiesterase